MTDSDTERQIGETMAVVLRERLVDLETLAATGAATKHTVGRLDFADPVWRDGHKCGQAASVSTGQSGRTLCYQCVPIASKVRWYFELQKFAELLLNKVFDTMPDILQSDGASGGLVLFVRARPCREEGLA